MQCEHCRGQKKLLVAGRTLKGVNYGPHEEVQREICTQCGGVGTLPDLVLNRSFLLQDGILFFCDDVDGDSGRRNLAWIMQERFPQIRDRPVKLRITIEQVDAQQ